VTRRPLTFGSLFAGIGGFDLGFERAGMKCVWQVELDEWCRKVLAKHWPDVPKWDDVRTFTGDGFERPDVICGGFPCQDLSRSGKRAGIWGSRSGLWSEFARIIRVVRPRIVVVENVAAITDSGLGRVLADLASLGFDAEWDVLPACAFGAPHSRERMFVVAHVDGNHLRTSWTAEGEGPPAGLFNGRPRKAGQVAGWWATQPEPCSVVYGVPGLVDRLRPYGNAVVPQVAEFIGRRLMEARL